MVSLCYPNLDIYMFYHWYKYSLFMANVCVCIKYLKADVTYLPPASFSHT